MAGHREVSDDCRSRGARRRLAAGVAALLLAACAAPPPMTRRAAQLPPSRATARVIASRRGPTTRRRCSARGASASRHAAGAGRAAAVATDTRRRRCPLRPRRLHVPARGERRRLDRGLAGVPAVVPGPRDPPGVEGPMRARRGGRPPLRRGHPRLLRRRVRRLSHPRGGSRGGEGGRGPRHRPGDRLLRAAAEGQPQAVAEVPRADLPRAGRPGRHRSRGHVSRTRGPAPARPHAERQGRRVSDPRRDHARQPRCAARNCCGWTTPSTPSSCRCRDRAACMLDDGSIDPAGLRRQQRPPVPVDRPLARRPGRTDDRPGVDAGNQGVGGAQPAAPEPVARAEPELRVLPRSCRSAIRRRGRRARSTCR